MTTVALKKRKGQYKNHEVPVTRYNIDTSAMLVELSASVWTARKLDRSTTDEVVRDKHARSKDAARVNKHLLAGRNELEIITKHVNAVRTYVYTHTMPWSDSGQRLLPVIKFMEFEARMKEEEDRFWELVEDFVQVYPTIITAQAMALGDMFKREDFPAPGTIREKFAFKVGYLPVPTAGDFRIQVGEDAAKELQERLAKLADERVEAAIGEVKGRLKEHLERMADRLQVDVVAGEEKPRKFHDSLVEGGLELCDLIKSLNIVEDPDLEGARRALEHALLGVTPKELREEKHVRQNVKHHVDEILSKFNW